MENKKDFLIQNAVHAVVKRCSCPIWGKWHCLSSGYIHFIEGMKWGVKVTSSIVCFIINWVKQFPVQPGSAQDAQCLV